MLSFTIPAAQATIRKSSSSDDLGQTDEMYRVTDVLDKAGLLRG